MGKVRRSVGLSQVNAARLRVVILGSQLPVRNRSLVGFLGLRAFQIDRTRVVVWSPPATVVLPVTTSRRCGSFICWRDSVCALSGLPELPASWRVNNPRGRTPHAVDHHASPESNTTAQICQSASKPVAALAGNRLCSCLGNIFMLGERINWHP